ncbi:hypothetical protein OIDMADRAFT_175379 [Oidiodendron maius Zn]|uniref:Thioredoxin domain-containing protein n=1 Tax=Oidiodendron maius (strain Zn) TaxID=913774 RepID=A0A0C3I2I4_OIDMZ|nr:hypothetical protein OIDMADRAFT_175379 [Oidiodendron maius Zn]
MRLLPISLLFALCGAAMASNLEKRAEEKVSDSDAVKPTVFNGVEVPPLTQIEGQNFNTTIKDGWWIVKHHSPWCGHCKHVAPIFQTLYEFYYTSKPVPTENTAPTSLNTFTAYYNFHFGALDCVAFADACTEHGVSSYPTFVLYHDGEEQKKWEGSRAMKGLSEMVEETLETIKPGSRPIGGPSLPSTGDSSTSDYIASTMVSSSHDDKEKVLAPKAKVDSDMTKPKALHTTSTKKSSKATPTPNLLGVSVPLTAEKFRDVVTMTQDPWFIKFYAPWCGHCQAMAPNWVQLAKEMKGRLNVGEVNCDVETRLCKDVKLRGYPTILFFRGGERVEYEGLRGLGDFISYANKAIDIGDGVKDVTAAEFEALEEKEEVIFLYFYDHATTTEDFMALERLTLSLVGHAKLVKTDSPELAERYKITTFPRLIVSRDGLPTYYTALAPQDMRDFRQVLHWMKSVWLPIVPELTSSNARDIMDGRLVVLGILSRERPDEFEIARKELKNAAIEWIDKETVNFQRERQELRDSKQLRIEEAEDRNDQRALRNAKSIRITMDKSNHKEVGFAWVDGVFWERWIRQTYGIDVSKDGEKVIINDEDARRYWDQTITGNSIMASRTSILETIPKVISSPPVLKPKSTIGSIQLLIFDIRGAISSHKIVSIVVIIVTLLFGLVLLRRRIRRNRGGFFRLDEKDSFLGGGGNGKVD